jgi:nucleoside-diphosphate-sugar epimerase
VVDYLRLPLETMRVNSEGTRRLLEVARTAGSRFLFASTSEIYGDPLEHPQREIYWGNVNPNGPRSCYDESKRFAEALTAQYGRSFGLDVRIVRIFNTYGPHSRLDDGRVVPNFVGQALLGKPITIYGDGSQTRSFCYVSDLVAGIMATMFAPDQAGEVFNLGNPEERTILEFAETVARICGQSMTDFERRPLPIDDPTRRRPDISKARQLLGWEPQVDIEAGLRQTIEWFRVHLGIPQPAGAAIGAGLSSAGSGLEERA